MTQPPVSSRRPSVSPHLPGALARLRAEQLASKDAAPAYLLHELAFAQEPNDEAAATRDYLAAFNADPRFREPLEALVRLFARRSSTKNLAKLLDALVRTATTPDEKARANWLRGAFLLDHVGDTDGAQQAFEAILEERPDDPTAWLELELLGAAKGDIETRAKALEARSSLAQDPSWRGLLLLDRARLESDRGNVDTAFELLDAARKLPGVARYAALRATEALGRRVGRHVRVADALEARAELIGDSLADPTIGDRYGVPPSARRPEYVADAWLRAAEARRRLGDPQGAKGNLDRAAEHLPDHAYLKLLQLEAARAAKDDDRVIRIAENLLEAGVPARTGASLWSQIADAVVSYDRAFALEVANKALALDPECVPASVLRLELLAEHDDPERLAEALDARAQTFTDEEAQANAQLLAAYEHAAKGNVPAAKTALARAASLGAPPLLLARTTRLVALLLGEPSWLEDANQRIVETAESAAERTSLFFELARQRLLQRALANAHEAIASLAAEPDGSWLGDVLLAYAEPALQQVDTPPGPDSVGALDRLRRNEPRVELANALALVAATRADALGDLDGAKARLNEVNDELAAMYLADLERRQGDLRAAARHLARAAELATDEGLATALRVEAFVLAYRAGDKAAAVSALSSAPNLPPAAKQLVAWALRGATPDDPAQRVRALDMAAEAGERAVSVALEQFGAGSLDPNATPDRVREWLDTIETDASGDLAMAAVVARLLAGLDGTEEALDKLASRSQDGAAVAACERFRAARARGDLTEAERAARAWVQADPSLAAALEWLSIATACEDAAAEALARKEIAERLDDVDRSAVLASAAAVELARNPDAVLPPLDPSHVPSRLMNLELAPPGCDPRRRAQALGGFDGALGADAEIDALLLAGQNHLAAGDVVAALLAFQKVTEARPDEIWGWEGVKAAAEALGDPRTFALACAHLGELCQDARRGAEHWERAGLALIDLGETERGEFALEQAFLRDPTRTTAFDRLFRRVREAGQHDKLLSLISRRLEVADDPAELAKLFWEQARSLRQQGQREAALAALESVTAIEPDHIGALALSGEIFITQGRYAEAAQALSRLASLPDAPDKQRLMSGIAAVDLYENKLGDSIRALEVLVGLHEARLTTLPVRERLARAAAKTQSWQHAATIFEELMNDRPTREGRIEAARLAMVLWRDKLGMPARAEKAAAKLLAEAPDDAEAIDVAIESPFDPAVKRAMLTRSREVLVAAVQADPTDVDTVARLSGVAKALGDLPLRQATLGATIALGRIVPAADTELGELDARVATTPQVALDDAAFARIADPEDTGPIARLFDLIAAPVGEALGPSLAALGVGKKDRLDPRGGFPVRNEVAAWAGALGLREVEVYIGGQDPELVQGVAGDTPAIVLGTAVRAPLHPRHRQAIARELFALRRGISVVRTRDEATVAALVVAACHIADVDIDAPPYAILADIQRQLAKTLPRRTRKLLPELCREIVASKQDPKRWARAALLSMHRIAAIAAGDVSIVLADWLGQPRHQLSVARHERARRLIAFVLSPDYLELRERLGMGIP